MHDKLRSGSISPSERARYAEQRTQFVRMMVLSQQIGMAGHTLRSDLRMAKMLKVEIRAEGFPNERVTTQEIATKGFSALMPKAMPVGSTASFTLFLPKPAQPITGRVTIASARTSPSSSLVKTSFKFESLLPAAEEQLDIALIDAIFERLTKF